MIAQFCWGRAGADRRWQAVVVGGLAIALLLLWVPYRYAGEFSFATGDISTNSAPATAPSIAAPPAPAARPQRQSGSRRHDDGVDCANISPDARAAVGCPLRP
ncbi:MAG: hypothetical protein AAB869_00640 [Patescibacteria group bacterium]